MAAAAAASSWDFIVLVALIAFGPRTGVGRGGQRAASTGAFIARSFLYVYVYSGLEMVSIVLVRLVKLGFWGELGLIIIYFPLSTGTFLVWAHCL